MEDKMVDQKVIDKFMADELVAEVRLAKTPLYSDGSGGKLHNRAYYTKAVELVLIDESLQYGCTWDGCTYTADNPTTVAGRHYKTHEVTPDLRRTPFKDWTLEQILGRLQDNETDLAKVIAQRDLALKRVETVRAAAKNEVADLKAKISVMEKEVADFQKAVKTLGKLGLGKP